MQGVIDEHGHGGIRTWRGAGYGRGRPALMLKALAGFAACGVRQAYLEVTASNLAAMRMYRSLGFRCTKTVYRSVPAPEPVAVGL